MKPSCFIRFLVFTLLATLAIATGAAAQGQAPALPAPPNLDVVGIKLGMPVKDALAALKADNLGLTLVQQTLQLEGFDQPLLTSVMAQRLASPAETPKVWSSNSPCRPASRFSGESSGPTAIRKRIRRPWTTPFPRCAKNMARRIFHRSRPAQLDQKHHLDL